jgi:hypothetical protein
MIIKNLAVSKNDINKPKKNKDENKVEASFGEN